MSEENQKLGYCSTCNMNVPHWREQANGLSTLAFDLLQQLRAGRWHCVRCQRGRLFLPSVSKGAIDYWVDAPSDPVDPVDPTLWLRKVNEREAMSRDDVMSPLVEDRGQQSIQGVVQKTLFVESRDTFRDDSLVVAEANRVSAESQQSASDKVSEVTVAEPAGNFIKEQSLAVSADRMKRFTEKYRDALVERILSGQARMSWLIADGKCTEAELLSWIDDKLKRESTDENQTIEVDSVPQSGD